MWAKGEQRTGQGRGGRGKEAHGEKRLTGILYSRDSKYPSFIGTHYKAYNGSHKHKYPYDYKDPSDYKYSLIAMQFYWAELPAVL